MATATKSKGNQKRKGGRRAGNVPVLPFFDKRGHWAVCTALGSQSGKRRNVRLLGERGEVLTDPNNREPADAAYARLRVENASQPAPVVAEGPTVRQLIREFLEGVQASVENGSRSSKTYECRRDHLLDFANGVSASRQRQWQQLPAKEKKENPLVAKRPGFGCTPAVLLTASDVIAWMVGKGYVKKAGTEDRNVIDGYAIKGNSARSAVESIHTLFNWAVRDGRLKENPLKGKLRKPAPVTTERGVSDEQVNLLIDAAEPDLKIAINVLRSMGMRPGEFVQLTAAHVHDVKKDGMLEMQVELAEHEHKTGKLTGNSRLIGVTEDVRPLFEAAKTAHPKGTLFRNSDGNAYLGGSLRNAFTRLRDRLNHKFVAKRARLGVMAFLACFQQKRKSQVIWGKRQFGKKDLQEGEIVEGDIVIDLDVCLYSFRHAFAHERIAQGYTCERLSGLMGNSFQVCQKHYAKHFRKYKGLPADAFKSAFKRT